MQKVAVILRGATTQAQCATSWVGRDHSATPLQCIFLKGATTPAGRDHSGRARPLRAGARPLRGLSAVYFPKGRDHSSRGATTQAVSAKLTQIPSKFSNWSEVGLLNILSDGAMDSMIGFCSCSPCKKLSKDRLSDLLFCKLMLGFVCFSRFFIPLFPPFFFPL